MSHFGIPPNLFVHAVNLPTYPDSTIENGCAVLKHKGLKVIWSNGEGWEHVSVSRRSRVPSYEDMCWIKSKWWWNPEHVVMQLHVGKSDHINCHSNCLHLWRPTDQVIPTPPKIFVGPG